MGGKGRRRPFKNSKRDTKTLEAERNLRIKKEATEQTVLIRHEKMDGCEKVSGHEVSGASI